MSPVVIPTGKVEAQLRARGFAFVAGVDEAGAGALAGPVVAGAAILPVGHTLEVRDSKSLSEKRREVLYEEIVSTAVAWGVGVVSSGEIDSGGIRPANYKAMRLAIEALGKVDRVLVDAYTIPNLGTEQVSIIKGDQKEFCIAAASILAKVTRDRMMKEAHQTYPMYGFDAHKGYGTRAHREAVQAHGRSPLHRASFTIRV